LGGIGVGVVIELGGVGAGFVVEFEGVESREHEENQESKSEREE